MQSAIITDTVGQRSLNRADEKLHGACENLKLDCSVIMFYASLTARLRDIVAW